MERTGELKGNMANRIKEEEKNEKIIRGLLKLPANKRCINCNSLGPQYVCTTFWSFICTNCSGLHREFTHRVKSISMAKFTSQEVNALQGGGNERAREIYFKEWDSQKHSYPDSSHLDRLRDFIKHVYVERRYAGGKNIVEPPRVKGERDDYDENRSFKTYRSGSRSPPYNDSYEKNFGERPGSARNDDRNSRFNYEARSPGYDKGDDKSPNRFEMRDEITRDDKAGNDVQCPKSYKSRTSEELPKPGVYEDQKNVYISSPPLVRPVRDILGSDIPPLRVGELPKTNGGKASNSPSETQSSTSSEGPNNRNSVELKRVNSGSLIDFSADSEHPTSGAVNEFVPPQTDSTPADGGCWASFDILSQQKAPKAASPAGDLQSVFAQLFVNAPTPAVAPPFPPAASTNSLPLSNNSGQWPAVQQQPSSFQVSNHSTNPIVHAPVGSVNKLVTAPLVGPFPSAVQGAMAVLDGQSSHTAMHLSHQRTVFGNSQNSLEVEGSGRKELPADLFTGVYSTSSASYPAWRMGPHHGMVYRMQYPVMMQPAPYSAVKQSAPTFHTSVSTNPFDLGNESASAPNPVINPSAALQAVASNNQLSLANSSNFAVVPLQWMPQQQFPYSLSAFPGPYMMQQFPHDMPRQPSSNFFPAVNQGVVSEAIPSGVSISGQPPAQTNSSVQSTEGNPFG